MKKIIIPIVCFLLGILVCFLYHDLQRTPIAFGTSMRDMAATMAPLSNRIDTAYARRLAREYQQNWRYHGLVTLNGTPLKGFYIDSGAINNIMRQDSCNGMRVYLAMHPSNYDPTQRVYTIIFVGTKKNGANKNPNPLDIRSKEVYEYVDPCPDNCDPTNGSIGFHEH